MDSLDITSDELRDKGFRLIKHDTTIVLENSDGNQARSCIYDEWNDTIKKFEDEIEKKQMVKDNITQQEIYTCLSRNYDKLYNGHASASTVESSIIPTAPVELTEDLTRELTYEEVAAILSTSIKKDKPPKLITFNGMLLAQTNRDQVNVGFQAESAAGKSYIPLEVASYFPQDEIVKIAEASPKAFYHKGVWDEARRATVCDLERKIVIFLDLPHFQLLERMRTVLSKDDKELISYIVDKNKSGAIRTKTVIIRGFASFFFLYYKNRPRRTRENKT